MNVEEFLELTRTRRSIRAFKKDALPDNAVEKILEAGRWAPSGHNTQPWEFVVIRNKETHNKIADIFVSWRAEVMKARPEFAKAQAFSTGSFARAYAYLRDVPVMILVCGDNKHEPLRTKPEFAHLNTPGEYTFYSSLAAAVQNMLLTIHTMGLGSVWLSVQMPPVARDLRPLLGIPEEIQPVTLLPVGYPAESPTRPRKPLSDVVHMEKY